MFLFQDTIFLSTIFLREQFALKLIRKMLSDIYYVQIELRGISGINFYIKFDFGNMRDDKR